MRPVSRRTSVGATGPDGDGGSIALLTLIVAVCVFSLGSAVVAVTVDLAVASARARTAADAAALAAMAASPLAGGDGNYARAAESLADLNGARLASCCGREMLDVEVQVVTPTATPPLRAVLPLVSARAAASLAPPPPEEIAAFADGESAGPRPGTGGRLLRPTAGQITSGFGWRTHPITGDRRFHTGIDFGAPPGTSIVAVADGVVAFAGSRGGYGETVDLTHANGLVTRYAHQSVILVRPGQRVRRGDVIGRVGSTGHSTGPHLHFEVRVNGRPRDPAGYL